MAHADIEKIKNRGKMPSTQIEESTTWIPVARWDKFMKMPSKGTLRNIVARRKENGAWSFLAEVNGRFYVNLQKFNEWMSNQRKGT